jgi:hypothetical protein
MIGKLVLILLEEGSLTLDKPVTVDIIVVIQAQQVR